MINDPIPKSPSFQLYPKDALDLKVIRMSDAAQGVYWRLIFNIWAHTATQYSIADDDKKLSKMLGLGLRKWKFLRAEIQDENDPLLIEHDGMLVSKRLMQEREKQLVRRKQTQAAANIRWHKDAMQTHMQTDMRGACPSTSTSTAIASSTAKTKTKPFVYECEFFKIDAKTHKSYEDAFPDVDIMAHYKKMAAWLVSHPRKYGQIMVFVYEWLQKEQGSKAAFVEIGKALGGAKGMPTEAYRPPRNQAKPPETLEQRCKRKARETE